MTAGLNFDAERSALLLVDIQPDFMPGGALAVEEGDRIIEPVRQLMDTGPFRHFVATQDWHPPGHISFASSHDGREPFETMTLYGHDQTLWTDHCIQNSPGAALHEDLPWEKARVIVRKGQDPTVDSYSGFRNNWNPQGERPPTGLAGYLRELGIDEVFICGLARDVCVKWTAEDAVEFGFKTHLLWDLSRSVDPSGDNNLQTELKDRGVDIIDSGQLRQG